MEPIILAIVAELLKQVAQLIQDLQDGKIDPAKIDLDAVRAGIIALPKLPE